jgi:DNA-binding transcriptional ArsR family regulator
MGRSLDGITRVEFVPNALFGPYLVYTPAPPVMTIAFNALGPAARVEAQDTYPVARRLYPVLDALADHTRLRIVELLHRRECYAHEIAEAVSLSPSVISRHLQRLEQAGLVRVRRAGTSKFYSLDGDRGQALVTALQEMLSN